MDLAKSIEQRWADYLRLFHEGAIYSAVVRLAEIDHCLRFASLSPELKSKWSGLLKAVVMTSDMVQSILKDAQSRVERLSRMLGGGSSVTYEEMLLLITMRVELEMLFAYLAERGIASFPDVSSFDEDLSAAVRSPRNSGTYATAQHSARKNWGLPLRSKWLGIDGTH